MVGRLVFGACLLAAISMALAGCSRTYRVVLKGSAFPARPLDCEITFSDVDPDKAASVYQQVGIISVDGLEDELTEGVKEELRRRACKMGGHIVVPLATDQGVEEVTSSFLVLTGKVEQEE